MKNAEWKNPGTPTVETQQDFYQKIRRQVRRWAKSQDASTHKASELVLVAPDLFHLLCKLVADPRVSAGQKAKLGLVLAYFISPLDLLPEVIFGPAGYADDVALAAMVLNGLIKDAGEEIVREHWAGDGDVLLLVERILAILDRTIGSGLKKKLQRLLR